MIKKPRGTKDLYGSELAAYREIIRRIEKIFLVFGYEEIKTPIYEKLEVFDKSDESNITANKEFFYIRDRKLTKESCETFSCVLRPELTAPILRALVENNILNRQTEGKIHSYYYCGECFRYDRPQSGRYRQFTQMGIEKINASDMLHDVENVRILHSLVREFGLENRVQITLNYFGSAATKKRWNEALKDYFRKNKERLSLDSVNRIEVNPFRILDDSKKEDPDLIKNVPKISDFYSSEEMSIYEEYMDTFKGSVKWDYLLVRGLDYYTGLVYELIDVESGLTIAAGGRYDDLSRMFYPKNLPSLGLAVGVDRLRFLLGENINFPPLNKTNVLYASSPLDPEEFKKRVLDYRLSLLKEDCLVRVIVYPEVISEKSLRFKFGNDVVFVDIHKVEIT